MNFHSTGWLGTITYVNTRTDELPKAIKREIRQLSGVVHERLLDMELRKLDADFTRWRQRELDAFELSAQIHRFHEGQPRRLWIAFNTNSVPVLVFRVKEGLGEGILREDEISEELLAFLRTIPSF